MCLSSGGIPAQPPAPTQNTASSLELGTSEVQRNNAGALGRLALTSNRNRPSGPTPTPGTSTTGSTPAGTLGSATGPANVYRSPFGLTRLP